MTGPNNDMKKGRQILKEHFQIDQTQGCFIYHLMQMQCIAAEKKPEKMEKAMLLADQYCLSITSPDRQDKLVKVLL